MADVLTDKKLSHAFEQGDQGAFTDIYNRYWDELFIHALKMLKDADQATDAVQDAFMVLLTSQSPFNQVDHIGHFLHGCMRHQIISQKRRGKAWENYLTWFQQQQAKEGETSDADIWGRIEDEQQRLQQLIEKEIAALPPKMRMAFELAHRENMSHKEIASVTGTAKETVKKNIYNAMSILRRRLLGWLF
jgi:RNA polymerase sigma factor (sigma-70 family)